MAESTWARTLAASAVAVSLVGAGTACSSSTSGGPVPESTTSVSPAAEATPPSGFIEKLSGTEGTVTYEVELPQIRGGDAAVRETFNNTMRIALDEYLTPTDDGTPLNVYPGIIDNDGHSEVTHIGAGAVAGVLLVNIFVERSAHPYNEVSTAVIDARTAAAIEIGDLFTDEDAGLARLVAGIAAEIANEDKLAGQTAPEPVAEQLTDWVPDDDGLVVFIPVAHVLGDYYPVTVGWDELADVLKPGMRETLTD